MDRDYWPIIHARDALDGYSGYLDTAGMKEMGQVKGRYRTLRQRLVYETQAQLKDWDSVKLTIASELETLAANNNEWSGAILNLKDEIIDFISKESSRSWIIRAGTYYALPILIVIGAATYTGAWWYNNLTIDRPIESKEGLLQRAKAYQKARNFDDLMDGRGGLIKRAILSAVEPDDDELKAAQEFVGITLSGYDFLEKQGGACGLQLPTSTEDLNEQHLALVDKVTDDLSQADTKWVEPPAMTILPIIAQSYPCARQPAVSVAPDKVP